MAEKVTCIVKGDTSKYTDCRCITQIRTDAGTYTREQAHEKVKKTPNSIYVEAGTSKAYLIDATREGTRYVRTEPNDTKDDNLLKVRPC